jgi:HEAT repeat protein
MFLNVLRIRRAIAERTGGEIKPDLSAKLFVFEYVFQEFYKDVVKYKDQDLLCKLERLAKGDSDEELEEELEKSPFLKGYHENEDLSSLVRDEPLFCGIDIEPYIYLSGTEAFHEVAASDESTQDELLSGDYMKMKRAADAINKMPDSEKQRCLNVVMLKLKDGGTANVRRNAAKAIGAIGDAGAVEALIGVLEDRGEDANLRRNAASALGAIGDAGAVAALIGVLDDEDVDVCRNAASALGAIGDAGAVEALIGVLADMGKAANVRRNAAKALGAIGDAGAVAALIKALGDKNANVRRNAARALGRIGDPIAVPALEKVLKDRADDADLCVWVTEALEEIKVKQNQ